MSDITEKKIRKRKPKAKKIKVCEECKWFCVDRMRGDQYAECHGHPPRPNKAFNDPCHWPIVGKMTPICYMAEPIEDV